MTTTESITKNKVTVPAAEIRRVKGLGFLHCKGTNEFNARVITRNGKLTNRELKCIQEAAEKFGNGEVALTTRMTMECQHIPYENIEPFLEYLATCGLSTGGTGKRVRPVVSCKGTTCQYGLIDTHALSARIHEEIYVGMHDVVLPHKFKIAVGGCPNNCAKPNLNDLGIVGNRIPAFQADLCHGCKKCVIEANCPVHACKVVDGKLQISNACIHCGRCDGKCPFHSIENSETVYRVYVGGRWGKAYAIANPLQKNLHSEDEVLAICKRAVRLFAEQGIDGERFSDTVERLGIDAVERALIN